MTAPRARRILLGIVLIYPFWLGMMVAHELGHVIGAALTGGNVVNVEIPIVGFSRTDVSPNPWPRVEIWSGPVVGAIMPLALWAAFARTGGGALLQAFAGWCLVANGAYIGVGWIKRVGDAGELVRHGTSSLLMMAFGVACVSAGLYVWHKLGKSHLSG